jgi:hypothetical protein
MARQVGPQPLTKDSRSNPPAKGVEPLTKDSRSNPLTNCTILGPRPRTVQRVTEEQQRVREEEQRVIGDTPILTIPRITNAPPIMQAHNPTAKRALKSTPRIHWRQTRGGGQIHRSVCRLSCISIPSHTLTSVRQVGKCNNCRTSSHAPRGRHKHKRQPTPQQSLSGACQLEPNNDLCHNKR